MVAAFICKRVRRPDNFAASKNKIEDAPLKGDFSGAEIAGSNFGNNSIDNVIWKFTKFRKSSISNIVFTGILENCHFEYCGFNKVVFENATLLNTTFKYNEKFKKVKFVDCKVDSVTYAFLKNNQADLTGITLV